MLRTWLGTRPTAPLLVLALTIEPVTVVSSQLRGEVSGRLDLAIGADGATVDGKVAVDSGTVVVLERRYSIRVAELRFDGSLDPLLGIELEYQFPELSLRVGLRDAFVDVATGNKQLFVRGGFFQSWADPTRLVADTAREFVDRPVWSRGVRSTEGWFTDGLTAGRSIGAALRLEPIEANQFGIELAIQNGADEYSSNNDNDLPSASATESSS